MRINLWSGRGYRSRGRAQRLRYVIRRNRAKALIVLVGGAGFVFDVTAGSPDGLGIIAGIFAIGGAAAITYDIWDVNRSPYSFSTTRDLSVLEGIDVSERYEGFTRFSTPSGAAIRSRELDLALWDGADRRFSLDEDSWELPPLPQRLVPSVLQQRQRTSDIVFDAKKVSLRTDLTLASLDQNAPAIRLQPTSYFRGEVTNELTGRCVIERETGVMIYDGISMVATDGTLRNLEDSVLSNHIGGSSLAITDDKMLILTEQARSSAQEPDTLVPSGSGSTDLGDTEFCTTIGELALRGITRELVEECGVKGKPVTTRLCGYARILHRGGKPDFFALSRIRAQSSSLKVVGKERAFVETHQILPMNLDGPEQLRASFRSVPERLDGVPSFVLLLALRIVDDLLAERPDEVLEFLRGS